MMYVVSYTLNPQRPSFGLVTELQKSGGGNWWHYLDTMWIVATVETPQALYERLRPHFLTTDSLLIIELKSGFQRFGWLKKEAWDWIDARVREGWAS